MEPLLKNLEHKRTLPPYNPATQGRPVETTVAGMESRLNPRSEIDRGSRGASFRRQGIRCGNHIRVCRRAATRRCTVSTKCIRSTVAGVGVIDFDRDGWPDLYFTQGSKDPQEHDQTEHLDRLFRNLGDGHFADVTAQAGIVENAYSQGVSVGDVDNDGFPDILRRQYRLQPPVSEQRRRHLHRRDRGCRRGRIDLDLELRHRRPQR